MGGIGFVAQKFNERRLHEQETREERERYEEELLRREEAKWKAKQSQLDSSFPTGSPP